MIIYPISPDCVFFCSVEDVQCNTDELYTFVNNGTLVSGQKDILLYVVGSNNPVRSGCHDYIS